MRYYMNIALTCLLALISPLVLGKPIVGCYKVPFSKFNLVWKSRTSLGYKTEICYQLKAYTQVYASQYLNMRQCALGPKPLAILQLSSGSFTKVNVQKNPNRLNLKFTDGKKQKFIQQAAKIFGTGDKVTYQATVCVTGAYDKRQNPLKLKPYSDKQKKKSFPSRKRTISAQYNKGKQTKRVYQPPKEKLDFSKPNGDCVAKGDTISCSYNKNTPTRSSNANIKVTAPGQSNVVITHNGQTTVFSG